MGAGVGAIFRAPLAGALFAGEILYRDAELESDVIMPRDALWAIAQSNPRTLDALTALEVMGPWRLAAYGQELLRLL